jgi:hypothetical protein
MSIPKEAPPAKLIVGLLFRDPETAREVLDELSGRFGPLDFLSEPIPFTFTSYYDRELGEGILRRTGSFAELVAPETLPDIKLFTNALERRLSRDGKRTVNIDPGLLTEERVVLATGKNFTHRIYLRDGIYADLTLLYQKGAFQALPWTYADYRTPAILHLLGALRRKLLLERTGRLPHANSKPQGESP